MSTLLKIRAVIVKFTFIFNKKKEKNLIWLHNKRKTTHSGAQSIERAAARKSMFSFLKS
jgi:hypothetical protein